MHVFEQPVRERLTSLRGLKYNSLSVTGMAWNVLKPLTTVALEVHARWLRNWSKWEPISMNPWEFRPAAFCHLCLGISPCNIVWVRAGHLLSWGFTVMMLHLLCWQWSMGSMRLPWRWLNLRHVWIWWTPGRKRPWILRWKWMCHPFCLKPCKGKLLYARELWLQPWTIDTPSPTHFEAVETKHLGQWPWSSVIFAFGN